MKNRPSRFKYSINVGGVESEEVVRKFLSDSFTKVGLDIDFEKDVSSLTGKTIDDLKEYVLNKGANIENKNQKIRILIMAGKRKAKSITPFEGLSFLNIAEKDSSALIAVRVRGEIVSSKKYEDNYEIKITDCHNTVTLHGNLKNPESRKNALNKFDSLIKVLTDARNHVETELKNNKLKF